MKEDQAGSNPGLSYVALAGPNPKPMHDDFVATVYPQVHESLKYTTEVHVHLENPLSSSSTLSSMKNLDETFGDQFFNEKRTKEPRKANMETKVESMVTIPIYQASLTAPPLVFTLELRDLPHKINETFNEAIKEAVQVALQAPLKERFRDLSEAVMKEIIHDWMFESGTYRSQPEHIALYEALEASMERDNRDEFLAEKDKF
ncbi:hypothetical protein Tco_1144007 [Tanacetum coccineum]